MPDTKVRIETPSPNQILVHGLTVNYDHTPSEAVAGLPNNNSLIASSFPKELWSGDKTGIVTDVTLPFWFPRQQFSTSDGRRMQGQIGYCLPAEIAALKDEEEARKTLRDMGIWALVALRQSDEMLWRDPNGNLRPVYFCLGRYYLGLYLGYAFNDWHGDSALGGAPQV